MTETERRETWLLFHLDGVSQRKVTEGLGEIVSLASERGAAVEGRVTRELNHYVADGGIKLGDEPVTSMHVTNLARYFDKELRSCVEEPVDVRTTVESRYPR